MAARLRGALVITAALTSASAFAPTRANVRGTLMTPNDAIRRRNSDTTARPPNTDRRQTPMTNTHGPPHLPSRPLCCRPGASHERALQREQRASGHELVDQRARAVEGRPIIQSLPPPTPPTPPRPPTPPPTPHYCRRCHYHRYRRYRHYHRNHRNHRYRRRRRHHLPPPTHPLPTPSIQGRHEEAADVGAASDHKKGVRPEQR